MSRVFLIINKSPNYDKYFFQNDISDKDMKRYIESVSLEEAFYNFFHGIISDGVYRTEQFELFKTYPHLEVYDVTSIQNSLQDIQNLVNKKHLVGKLLR